MNPIGVKNGTSKAKNEPIEYSLQSLKQAIDRLECTIHTIECGSEQVIEKEDMRPVRSIAELVNKIPDELSESEKRIEVLRDHLSEMLL